MAADEQSVSFSLRELERIENERLDSEKKERQARELEVRRAHEEAIANAARARLEEERRAAEGAAETDRRRRHLEEEAKREAVTRAAVEQTRITVEARTRADQADRERAHEIELAQLRVREREKRSMLGVVVGSLASAAIAFFIAGGMYLVLAKPSFDRQLALVETRASAAEARERELASTVLDQKKSIDELGRAITSLKAPPSPPSPAKKTTDRRTPGTTVRAPIPPPPALDPPCKSGDPMCPKIGSPASP